MLGPLLAPPTASPAERFAAIMERLMWVIFRGNTHPLLPSVISLIHRLMARYRMRFLHLAAFVASGKQRRVMKRRPPRPVAAEPPPPKPRERRKPPEVRRGTGWMCRLVPMHAATAGRQIWFLVQEPEVKELVLSDPRFAPLLRSLLRMLGQDIPPILRLPPRERRPRPLKEKAEPLEDPPNADPPRKRRGQRWVLPAWRVPSPLPQPSPVAVPAVAKPAAAPSAGGGGRRCWMNVNMSR